MSVGRWHLGSVDVGDDGYDVGVAYDYPVVSADHERAIDLHAIGRIHVETEITAAAQHSRPPRVLAQDQRIPGRPDVFRLHDLVGAAILQDPVLVDARFMSKRVAADDGLVDLHTLPRQLGEHLARWIDLLVDDPHL